MNTEQKFWFYFIVIFAIVYTTIKVFMIDKLSRFLHSVSKENQYKTELVEMEDNPYRNEYIRMYNVFEIDLSPKSIKYIVTKINYGYLVYKDIAEMIDIPYEVIATLHMMESSCDFKRQLLNGERFTKKTTRVPKGKGPWKSWEDSTIDYLTSIKTQDNWEIANTLYFLEGFNGYGYRKHGVNSPYLWGGTNFYTKGKYIEDGKFDPDAVSKQAGAAVLLKLLDY